MNLMYDFVLAHAMAIIYTEKYRIADSSRRMKKKGLKIMYK